MGKTLSSHIIHSLGGEYCWLVQNSEPSDCLSHQDHWMCICVYTNFKY